LDEHDIFRFLEFYIPTRMVSGINRWILFGTMPGDFLQAVIANDLREACMRADDENIRNLPAYVSYFYNCAPIGSWGSYANRAMWEVKGGIMGIEQAEKEKRKQPTGEKNAQQPT